MAGKTAGDKIEELQKTVAALGEAVNNLRKEVEPLAELTIKVAVLETQMQGWERWALRLWAVLGPVAAAATVYYLGLKK
ncbi:MAG TPA: hypothetical protein VFG68_09190 [Fimbriiglobus sp.]|nr:hypothetical protein [Fimbriiglobus sp.]